MRCKRPFCWFDMDDNVSPVRLLPKIESKFRIAEPQSSKKQLASQPWDFNNKRRLR